MVDSNDKRSSERVNLEFDLKYKNIVSDMPPMYRVFDESKTKDISRRGACIRTRTKIDENSVLRAEMKIGERVIRTFCEVKWSGMNKDTGNYEAGLRFVVYNEDDIQFFEEYIEKYRGQCKGRPGD